jgi:hypothetical protein
MKTSSCSIKLLEKAYIGERVRMSSDSSTVPFKNTPMKGVKIIGYSTLGFRLSHPNLPKEVWVDFHQLPLTQLNILNGEIQNEITFVENIINHKMELIKTDMLDYIELLDIRFREQFKKILTLSDIALGDTITSALCENGEPMIYLGSWYTKGIIKEKWYSYGNRIPKYYLSNVSPLRAFFLVKTSEILPTKKQREIAMQYSGFGKFNYNDRWGNREKEYKEAEKLFDTKVKELNKNTETYHIINFPTTSKKILNIIPINEHIKEFENKDFNKDFIFNNITNNAVYDELCVIAEKHKEICVDNFPIIFESYHSSCLDVQFLADSKENINDVSRIFIKEYFGIKLEEELRNA